MEEIQNLLKEMLEHARHNQTDVLYSKALYLPVLIEEQRRNIK